MSNKTDRNMPFWIRQNKYYDEIKWNIYHRVCLFPFLLFQTCKTLFQWIIVQDDKKFDFFLPLFIWNFFFQQYLKNVCIGQFVVNEMYSYICLRVFLWKKKYTTTVATLTKPHNNRMYFHTILSTSHCYRKRLFQLWIS